MEIKGLDYNTQREKLAMPEYGREIQKMVDIAITLPTKEERNLCARTIIQQMGNKSTQAATTPDYEQTLWDHLYLMSHQQLDIDWPYDVVAAEKIHTKPQPVKLQKDENPYPRHYGRMIGEMFELLKTMPEGEERNELVRQTANQMKRDLATWGHGSIEDEKVADDLARFTDGKIQIDLASLRLERVSSGGDPSANSGSKRRRKK